MNIESPIDPRLISLEQNETSFEVRDWFSIDTGGPAEAETSARITEASIWEVLEWASQSREPRPVASFIWAVEASGPTRLLLGVLDWSEDISQPPVQRATLPEPDSDEGWKYFNRHR